MVGQLRRTGALAAALATAVAVVFAMAIQPAENASVKSAQLSNSASQPARIAKLPNSPNAYVDGELIVGLDDAGETDEQASTTLELVSRQLAKTGLTIGETLAPAADTAGSIVLATVANEQKGQLDLRKAEEAIAAIPGVSFVQPNYRYAAASTEAETAVRDANASEQWYLNSWDGDTSARGANVVAAWELLEGRELAPVDVAVLDTGAYSMPYETRRSSDQYASGTGESYFFSGGEYDPALFHQEFDADNLDMNHGIDFVHRDDGGRIIWDGPIVNSYNPYGDDNGHGTHISATIAAHASTTNTSDALPVGMAGISQTARIVPMKVLDAGGSGITTDFIRAYNKLIKLKEDGTLPNLRIVNMSFALTEEGGEGEDGEGNSANGQTTLHAASLASGLTSEDDAEIDAEEADEDPVDPPEDFSIEAETENTNTIVEDSNIALQSVVSRAAEHGIVTVCAAGNEGSTAATSPADLDDCISVTALDKDGRDAQFSNRNAKSDISAPGTDIYSAWASQADAYRTLSGTSQAAAITSGVLSLLWSANPNLSIEQVKEAVYRSAHAESNTNPDVNGSFGAIDAAAALEYVLADSWQGVPQKAIDEHDADNPQEPTGPGESSGAANSDDTNNSGNSDERGSLVGPGKTSPISLKSAKVTLSKTTCIFTGRALKPKVSVTLDGKKLKQGTDFTVRYLKNVKPGKAQATVTGKGAYTGSKPATFKIALGKTKITKLRAAKRAFTVTWKRQKRGAVGYQIRFSTKKNMKGPSIKTIAKNKKVKLTVKKAGKKKLQSKKRYYVQVRTYKVIGNRTYYSAWSPKRNVKTR